MRESRPSQRSHAGGNLSEQVWGDSPERRQETYLVAKRRANLADVALLNTGKTRAQPQRL